MQWNNTQFITRKSGAPWQELDKKVLILSAEKNMAHELNETASWLWNHLEKKVTFTHLVEALTGDYNVDHEMASKDVSDLLSNLKERGLLEWQ